MSMQRCELADECCVCNIPFCPYDSEDYGQEEEEWYEDDDDEGW